MSFFSKSSIGGAIGSVIGAVAGGPKGAAVGYDLGSGLGQYADDQAASKQAYNRQIALWNMNNAYNTPVQQMARLQEAGLNPNLVYGSGGFVNSSSSASGVAPTKLRNNIAQLSMYQQLQNMEEQNNYLRSQINNLNAQNSNISAQNKLINAQVDKTLAERRLVDKQNARWEYDHASPYREGIDFFKDLFVRNSDTRPHVGKNPNLPNIGSNKKQDYGWNLKFW